MNSTIAAISTPPGKGGVAIIRMSGEESIEILSRVFTAASGKVVTDYPPRTQVYGYIIYNNERIDDGLVTVFPAPHSYTGETVVEISCHGGILITETVLKALFVAGATPAASGEFTRRAFINGRLTLTEAEAIGNLIEARSEEQIRLCASPARQRLRDEIAAIRKEITRLLSSIYARIDYPDEDLGDMSDSEVTDSLLAIRNRLTALIDTYRTGKAISEGISAVICGKPNVGKSTLYNLILGEDAAIVTDIAGTTRDVLERSVPLGRVMLRLTDTAGIRNGEACDGVERIGIERSVSRIAAADLVIALFDLSRPLDSEDDDVLRAVKDARGAKICILSKSDLDRGLLDRCRLDGLFDAYLTVCCEGDEAECIRLLTECVDRLFTDEKISTSRDAVVASVRQHSALVRARDYIDTATLAMRDGIPVDAASSDIELALGAIGELDGRSVSDEVTADIFSRFCVGK